MESKPTYTRRQLGLEYEKEFVPDMETTSTPHQVGQGVVSPSHSHEGRALKMNLNCDQVSSLMFILNSLQSTPYRSNKEKNAAKMAALLDIMELLVYEFEDNAAAGNALSAFWEFNELRRAER
jgi:hypothetical protein